MILSPYQKSMPSLPVTYVLRLFCYLSYGFIPLYPLSPSGELEKLILATSTGPPLG
jgi:hypothetical protein